MLGGALSLVAAAAGGVTGAQVLTEDYRLLPAITPTAPGRVTTLVAADSGDGGQPAELSTS